MQFRINIFLALLLCFLGATGQSVNQADWVKENCTACAGKGKTVCVECSGKGQLACQHCGGRGSRTCAGCGGAGSSLGTKCDLCRGSGKTACQVCDKKGTGPCTVCWGSGVGNCATCNGTGLHIKYPEQARTANDTSRSRSDAAAGQGWGLKANIYRPQAGSYAPSVCKTRVSEGLVLYESEQFDSALVVLADVAEHCESDHSSFAQAVMGLCHVDRKEDIAAIYRLGEALKYQVWKKDYGGMHMRIDDLIQTHLVFDRHDEALGLLEQKATFRRGENYPDARADTLLKALTAFAEKDYATAARYFRKVNPTPETTIDKKESYLYVKALSLAGYSQLARQVLMQWSTAFPNTPMYQYLEHSIPVKPAAQRVARQ